MFKVKHFIFRITSHFKIRNNRNFGPNYFSFKILPVHFKVKFEKSNIWLQNVYRELLQCKKAGTWQFLFRYTMKIAGWNPYFSNYFHLTKHGSVTSNWGLGPEVREYKIKSLHNVNIHVNHYGVNSLNLYSFYAKKSKSVNIFQHYEVMNLMIGGSETFQHFIIDLLPILFACRTFLIANPNIPILLLAPNKEFLERNFYFDLLGLKNELINIHNDEYINCETMYFIDFKPHRAQYLNHTPSWNALSQFLATNKVMTNSEYNRKTLTFIRRNSSTRKISNEDEVIDFIHKMAFIYNLNVKVVNSSDYTRLQIYRIMQNTQIAISVHGGQGLNILGMEPNSIFIEFIPTKGTDTLGNIAHALNLKYLAIPVNYSKSDQSFEIPKNILAELEKFNLLNTSF